MSYTPLTSNKTLLDFTGVTAWHRAGYRGKGIKTASGEMFSVDAAASYGLTAHAPVEGYEGGAAHGFQTAMVFWQVAPDAELYILPYMSNYTRGKGWKHRLIDEGLPVVKAEGISLMFTSCMGTTDKDAMDAALAMLPGFTYFMSSGNDGGGGYNAYLACENIYGVGAYTLGGGKPVSETYSSVTEYVDFAAPAGIRIPKYGTLSTEAFYGTSCAAPYLAGMCALVQELFIEKTGRPLSRAAMYRFLLDHAVDFGAVGKDEKSGWGAVRLPKPEDVDIGRYAEDEDGVNFLACDPRNYTKGRPGGIEYIVIHYVGASGGAKDNCIYYGNNYVAASAHYFVGHQGEQWQSVPDNDTAWHCGAQTYRHPYCRNSNSIGIEMCCRKDASGKWYFEDATVDSAVQLTRQLMDKYGITTDRIVRHYDVTGKNCPAPYVENPAAWEAFKSRLEDEMTGAEIYAKLNEYLATQPTPAWAQAELQEAIEAGITDGTNPMTLIPRYQAALMSYRASKK
jgi:N-acetyl-anhydromuramyl-L-alanine amidase AmpD